MTINLALHEGDRDDRIGGAEGLELLSTLVLLDAEGDVPERSTVRPLADESYESWPGHIDRAIDAPRGAVVGVVSDGAAAAAVVACGLAPWVGAAGRNVVLVDGSVERPVIDKVLDSHGDEGLVDSVAFGLSVSAITRQTLTRNVRVVTAGSHPLDVDSVLAPAALRRVLAAVEADAVYVVLPVDYLQQAGPALDVVVAVARDAVSLAGMARRTREAGVRQVVGVLLLGREVSAEAPAGEREAPAEDAVPVTAQIGAGDLGDEATSDDSGEDQTRRQAEEAPAASEAPPRRNEFIELDGTQSPYVQEERRPAVGVERSARKHRFRPGFIGWLAISAAIIIVALTAFDMALRRGRLAWRPKPEERSSAVQPGNAPGEETLGGQEVSEDAADDGEAQTVGIDASAPGERPELDAIEGDGTAAGDEAREEAAPSISSPPAATGMDVAGTEIVPAGTGGPYKVLLSSHRLRSAADWDAGQAERHGLAATVVVTHLPERGTWYRVALAGGYPTLASARAALDSVKELGYEGAWLAREEGND